MLDQHSLMLWHRQVTQGLKRGHLPACLWPNGRWPCCALSWDLFRHCPITKAFCGRKKLLVYTSLHPLSRIKNIVFIHQARDSFRSKALFEALKKWPAARIDRQLS
jgi:hypothetical protein